MIYNNVLELIGKTPVLKLNNFNLENAAEVFVKLEKYNPGGSVKDRAALGMIEAAERDGLLKEGSVIVEPTSGNTGIALAMIIMAGIITFLLNNYGGFTYSFFAGLILASIVILYKQLDAFNIKAILITVIFAILGYIFVGLNPIQAAHSLPILFISGFIAICAMLLPGISGSSLLLLLGQYEYMINALHKFAISDIIVFIVGAGLGFMGMSRVIKYLLEHHKQETVAALIGIMLGSLRVPMTQIVTVPPESLIICLIIGIIGVVLVLAIDSKSHYELI